MSARTTIQLTPDVRAVLERSTITADRLVLPPGQLDRKLYVAVNKVLETAGGKWNRSAKAHIFPKDPRAALGLAMEAGEIVDTKKVRQAYYTPEPVARRLASRVGPWLGEETRVLEPSAGGGALVAAVMQLAPCTPRIDMIEISAEAVDDLSKRFLLGTPNTLLWKDFLDVTPDPVYDVVIMNPPFTKGQDAKHLAHAWQFVKPGGVLAAICTPNVGRSTTGPYAAVRELDVQFGTHREDLPSGTFPDTDVKTQIVVWEKP